MAKSKKIDKDMGFRLKKARLDQKLTYDELSEKSGVSSRYIKEIENHGNVPSLEKLGQLIREIQTGCLRHPIMYQSNGRPIWSGLRESVRWKVDCVSDLWEVDITV